MPTSANGRTSDGGHLLRQSLEITGQVLIPAGVITALLYYFGYVRERAFFSYFGINLGTLEFTTSDYVLRSAQAVFSPLASVFLLGVLMLIAHQLVIAVTHDGAPRWWRASWIAAAGISLGLLSIGASGLYFHFAVQGPKASAIALGVGAVLFDYSAWMATLDPQLSPVVLDTLRRSRWQRRTLIVGLALIAAFWWTASVATQNGLESAKAVQSSLENRGEAVVMSKERLGIMGTGVYVESLSEDTSGYAFRYTGLRVLVNTGDRWFLLPRGWTNENGDTVILLPDEAEGLRVDVRP
jgi:hypothetical protein